MLIYSTSKIAKNNLLFISGQTPEKAGVVPEDIEQQTDIVLTKILAIIAENNYDSKNILKMTVYITSANYLSAIRKVFTERLGPIKPTMTLVVVAGLIKESFKVEIDATVDYSSDC